MSTRLNHDVRDQYEWFTFDKIELVDDEEDLYCLTVDAPGHEFLIGENKVPTHNSDEAKAEQALKAEAASRIASIARLGRAAGIHLMIATQRPDAKLISGELKANLGARFACGNMPATASSMVLDNTDATKTPGSPKGRAIIKIYGNQERMQVYFAAQSWIDDWLARRGLKPDGSPLDPSASSSDVDISSMIDSTRNAGDNDNADSNDDTGAQGEGNTALNPLATEDLDGQFVENLAKLQSEQASTTTGKPEDEWNDYDGFMDEFQNSGD